MIHSDAGEWRRWLLAALACAGLVLLVANIGSSARAATRAPMTRAPIAHGSSSCGSTGSSSVFGFTNGTKLLSETDVPLCITGRLTVTFSGDRATGCAAHGLCDYAGTETWQPAGIGDLDISALKRRGRRFDEATMGLGSAGVPVHSAVQRSQATGTTTACSDEAIGEGGFFSLPIHGSRVTIDLDGPNAPLLGTRCAGPLDADVATALPLRSITLSRILHGRDTIDLTSSNRFAAHGLAGTVDSTIVLALGRPRRASVSSGSSPPGAKPMRSASVDYRVTRFAGLATATVQSSPLAAVCGPVDACGLQGTITVTPGANARGSAGLIATAPLRRPKRDLLAALGVTRRGNPSGIGVEGGGVTSGRGEVTADLTQQGGACRDQTGLRQFVLELRKRADRLQVTMSPNATQADPLRTRCPGPELGSQQQLTGVSVPLTVLRHPTFTVKLHGDSFSYGPYRVTTHSTLSVTLRRSRLTTRVLPYAARSR